MGLIDPNAPGDPSDAGDFGKNIAVLTSAPESSPSGPDASLLSRSDFPSRELPPVTGSRDARYQVVFGQSVLDEIRAHGKSSMEAEVCGVLIGDIYSDRLATWAYVEHCIRGNNAVGKQTQVTITSETWTRIHETLESKYPGKKILGWYHTHPGFGIFLSGMDLFIQDNFFNQPWQIATVYDPHSGEEGTFVWRSGKSVREEILVENNTGAPVAHAGATPSLEQLAQRVKRLERRLDVMLTGFLFLVLLALVVPLLVFLARPDMIKKIPLLHPASQPARGTPPPAVPAAPKQSLPADASSPTPAAPTRAAGQ